MFSYGKRNDKESIKNKYNYSISILSPENYNPPKKIKYIVEDLLHRFNSKHEAKRI